MTIVSRAIPGLFGGVSQQIPAMRHPTQGQFQLNAISTVVNGLFKRPGTQHINTSGMQWANGAGGKGNAFVHAIDRGPGSRYFVQIASGKMVVTNMETGANEPVVYKTVTGEPSTIPGYLLPADSATAFRCITVADTTMIVNTEMVVAPCTVDTGMRDPNVGYVYVRQAVGQHTYTITVNGNEYSYTTPVVTNVADIVNNLCALINQPDVPAPTPVFNSRYFDVNTGWWVDPNTGYYYYTQTGEMVPVEFWPGYGGGGGTGGSN